MVTLLERISLLAVGRQVEHPAEALALGQLCLQQGRVPEGISYLREASSFDQFPLAEEAALELAFYYKRQGNWADAVSIWQSAVEQKSANPFAYIELAKYYEHRCGNYQAALDLTEQALALIASQQNLPPSSASSREALNHRRQRLQRRINASIPPA